jgi:4-amino-4-deoxy-L-arabinose transferase-like glycosyltransferase
MFYTRKEAASTVERRTPAHSQTRAPRPRARIALDLLVLGLLVYVGYFARLSLLPTVGEEGRRARGAINMLETGDWVVVRQGGRVFPDRPPMSNWLIALAGFTGGEVDRIAIRLPSVLAILALTWLLYGYCLGGGASRLVAVTAATAFATGGQVLQLGRMGESEAVFTLFVAGSLLLWHLGYLRRWPPALAWSAGYGLCALGALTKGLQAPVYFTAATGAFLLWRRQWRWLLGWGQWFGLAVFCALVAAWQIPYYQVAGAENTIKTWFSVIGPRLGWGGLVEHVLSYPLETLGTLLPWSVVLFLLLSRKIRAELRPRAILAFAVLAVAVTYPSVWFSQGAKGRYYLPLYPCLAILMGLVVGSWVAAPGASTLGRLRRLAWGLLAAAACLGGLLAVLPWALPSAAAQGLRPTLPWTVLGAALALLALRSTLAARREANPATVRTALLALAFLLAALYNGVWNTRLDHRWVDLTPRVAALRERIPQPESLLSLGPLDSRFAFHYGPRIEEIPWPLTVEELPADFEYFSFDRRLTDSEQSRQVWRGMETWTTPGTLPFQWQEVGRVGVQRSDERAPEVAVIVGLALRDDRGRLLPTEP